MRTTPEDHKDDKYSGQTHWAASLTAAAISAQCEQTIKLPVDTWVKRLQNAGLKIPAGTSYVERLRLQRNAVLPNYATNSMGANVRSLYAGLPVAGLYKMYQRAATLPVQSHSANVLEGQGYSPIVAGTGSGIITGLVDAALVYPADTVKTRLQTAVQQAENAQKQLLFRNMYSGVGAAVGRNIIGGGATFGIMAATKQAITATNPDMNPTLQTVLSASAGIVGRVALPYAFDTVKVRAQSRPGTTTRDAARAIYREAGIAGFYRGILPKILSQAPLAAALAGYKILERKLTSGNAFASEPGRSRFGNRTTNLFKAGDTAVNSSSVKADHQDDRCDVQSSVKR